MQDIVGSHKQGDKQRSTVSKMSHKKDIGAVGMAGKASCGAESRGFPVTLYQGCPRASKQDSPMVTAQDYCYGKVCFALCKVQSQSTLS